MKQKQADRLKNFLQRATAGVALVTGLAAAGCSTVQTTEGGTIGVDRKQRMSSLVSEDELQAGALKAYSEVLTKERSEGNLNADPAMRARVQAIAQRIIPQTAAFRADAPKWQVGSQRHPVGTTQRLVHAGRKDRLLQRHHHQARPDRRRNCGHHGP
jgi:hypothetical protein